MGLWWGWVKVVVWIPLLIPCFIHSSKTEPNFPLLPLPFSLPSPLPLLPLCPNKAGCSLLFPNLVCSLIVFLPFFLSPLTSPHQTPTSLSSQLPLPSVPIAPLSPPPSQSPLSQQWGASTKATSTSSVTPTQWTVPHLFLSLWTLNNSLKERILANTLVLLLRIWRSWRRSEGWGVCFCPRWRTCMDLLFALLWILMGWMGWRGRGRDVLGFFVGFRQCVRFWWIWWGLMLLFLDKRMVFSAWC